MAGTLGLEVMLGIIYGLVDADTLELRYVGQTIRPLEVRLRRHRAARGNSHLRNWLAKRPVSIIALERNPADLDAAEIRWIAAMRAEGARLLNLTDGGEGGTFTGRTHTIESRAKMAVAHTGLKHTPETRARMSNTSAGHHRHTAASREKLRGAALGRTHSLETRAKLRVASLGNQNWLGRKHTPEARARMRAAKMGNQNRRGTGYASS